MQPFHVQIVTAHAGVLLSDATVLYSPWSPDVLGERVLHMLISCPVCHKILLTRSMFLFETIENNTLKIFAQFLFIHVSSLCLACFKF